MNTEPGNQYVGSGLSGKSAGNGVDRAVDFYQGVAAGVVNHAFQPRLFYKGVIYKSFSPPKAGVDAHQQHHVEVEDTIAQRRYRCGRADGLLPLIPAS